MGKILDEQGEAELRRIDYTSKILKEIEGPIEALANEWSVLAGPADKAEENQGLVDALNRGEIEERERGMNLADLEDIFERLGIDKKLEEIEPDLKRCRWLRDRLVDQLSHSEPSIYGHELQRSMESLKKVIEFIECIDEP